MNDGWNIFRGGLLRNDMTEKPSFKVLKHLFNEKWYTEESFSCNENGKGFFRGFYGTYNLEIDVNGKKEFRTFDLKKSSSENINILFNFLFNIILYRYKNKMEILESLPYIFVNQNM